MNTLDLVKAVKSATGDFGKFWTELYKITQELPKLFTRFGLWDLDRVVQKGDEANNYQSLSENTRDAFGIKPKNK